MHFFRTITFFYLPFDNENLYTLIVLTIYGKVAEILMSNVEPECGYGQHEIKKAGRRDSLVSQQIFSN